MSIQQPAGNITKPSEDWGQSVMLKPPPPPPAPSVSEVPSTPPPPPAPPAPPPPPGGKRIGTNSAPASTSNHLGDIYGFKLDYLSSLADLHVLAWTDQLAALDDAKRVSITSLRSEIGTLRKGLAGVTFEVEASEGATKNVLSSFLTRASETVYSIEKRSNQAIEVFTTVVAFFCDDAKTATPEEFFGSICKFRTEFKHSHDQIAKEPTNGNPDQWQSEVSDL
eukprot:gene12283-14397_t